ncbi:MAG: alpha-hydroxy-acid oxidizing protein [Alphaproteobacteria bacterium]|nr:alpha-hydroxy-acid oxidizing protein [Alphaproteobacteria bacterium]
MAGPYSGSPMTAAVEFETLHEIVQRARQNLGQNDWDYIVGGSETETTLRRNRLALDSIAFRPRVLRDVGRVEAGVEHFGRRMRLPVCLAPIGALEMFHTGAGASVARAAQAFGVGHMMSSVCKPGLEAVAAAAPDGLRLFQLYALGDEAFVDDHLARAAASGYAAFCLTVDTAYYSRRERDLAKRHFTSGRGRVAGRDFLARLDWRTVERVRAKSTLPLILKGIATAEDARIALDHGVDWIYVSNHGGRQLDHGRGTMEILPEIVDAVGVRAKIVIDGGFCRGSDVVKALAAGADLVGLGRMQCFALAAAGEAGILRMLELLGDEIRRCLGLLGVTAFAELDRSYLHAAVPANAPHVLSAFPLLTIDDYRY